MYFSLFSFIKFEPEIVRKITKVSDRKVEVFFFFKEKMPQLNSGGGDDLGANDEMIAFKDEGEQEEKIQENAFTERDLADLKSSLVNESEISQNSHPPVVFCLVFV